MASSGERIGPDATRGLGRSRHGDDRRDGGTDDGGGRDHDRSDEGALA